MKINEKDVVYVADLAHVELTQEERVHFLRDLNSILDYVDHLSELDTTNVQPMAQMVDRNSAGTVPAASREDIHEGLRKSLPHDVALASAPDSDGTFFRVPKVIER